MAIVDDNLDLPKMDIVLSETEIVFFVVEFTLLYFAQCAFAKKLYVYHLVLLSEADRI